MTDYGGNDNHTYTVTPNSDEKVVKFTHSMTDLYVQREIHIHIVNSENTSQYKDVIIYQHPAIELKKAAAGDVFVNGRFARVADARDRDGNRLGTSWTSGSNTYYHMQSLTWDGNRISGNGYNSSGYGTITAGTSMSSSISDAFYMTDITITAFASNNNSYDVGETTSTSNFNNTTNHTYFYKIGDPRVMASSVYNNWSLNGYMYDESRSGGGYGGGSWTANTNSWETEGSIMICAQDDNSRNIVAPHILVSSALNAMNNGVTFDNAVKRAATYQEAGYPAGRWRLPTEAEMAFIVARQKDGTIPNLYATNDVYWSGSGRVMSTSTSEGIRFRNRTNSETMSCRFVYDLWYWGDKPAWDGEPAAGQHVTNQYHPNGHVQSYKNQ